MGARAIAYAVASALATALALLPRVARPLAAALARLWRLASLRARVDGEVPASTRFDGAVETAGRVRLLLGERCRLGRRVFLETCGDGVIRLGRDVRVNAGTFIVAYAEVTIGDDALIGEYVSIRDADHGLAPDRLIRQQDHTAAPVRVGEGAWIGRGAVILRGVTVGAGAVVAANSVVTRDVRPMAIVAGAPARELKARDGSAPPAAAPRGAKARG